MTNEIELRPLTPDDLPAFLDDMGVGFGAETHAAEAEHERPLVEFDRFISAFDGDQRVGTSGAYSLRLSVPGGDVATGGITGVSVRPDHRRRGILRQMMDWLLADARRRGEPVAVLLASEAAIYHRFGFGMSTTATSFSIDRMRAQFREPVELAGSEVRLVEPEEAARTFAEIYERTRAGIPGALSRPEAKWTKWQVADAEWMRRGEGPKFLAQLEVDGAPRAYAIYRINNDWDTTGPRSTLAVQELIGLDPDSEQAMWQWLMTMDLVATISSRRQPNPHPLQQWLLEPRRLSLTVNDGMWLRILDVRAALESRGYVGDGSLVLELTDDSIDSNAGRWRLAVSGGRATVTPTTDAADLELDIRTLAEVYLGAFRFGDLAAAGKVRECQPGRLLTADALFTPPRAPWNATPF
ncbi:MAG TPA: GNAT family N-acetyltransferase [Candidatus Limnocylindrales bacterium]|nr:GNAT family N-acetyltransferase [Candidatus Limnocylindrales bacterium]